MDSELQAAIDVFEIQRGAKMYPGERLIVAAARKVANIDYEAAERMYAKTYRSSWQNVHGAVAQAIVDAALGIGGS